MSSHEWMYDWVQILWLATTRRREILRSTWSRLMIQYYMQDTKCVDWSEQCVVRVTVCNMSTLLWMTARKNCGWEVILAPNIHEMRERGSLLQRTPQNVSLFATFPWVRVVPRCAVLPRLATSSNLNAAFLKTVKSTSSGCWAQPKHLILHSLMDQESTRRNILDKSPR